MPTTDFPRDNTSDSRRPDHASPCLSFERVAGRGWGWVGIITESSVGAKKRRSTPRRLRQSRGSLRPARTVAPPRTRSGGRVKDSEISFAAPNQENRDRHHYNILGFPWWCAHQSPHRSRAPNTGFSSFAHARPGKRQRTHSCRSQARRIGVIVIACHSSPSSNCLMRWCYAVMCTRVSVGSALPLTTLATQAARALRSMLHRSYLWG